MRMTSQEEPDYRDVAPASMLLEQGDRWSPLLVMTWAQGDPAPARLPLHAVPGVTEPSRHAGGEGQSCLLRDEGLDEMSPSLPDYSTNQRSLHGLFSLLGYDEKEQRFTTMPHKIRTTPQFCSFFASLPQVMDNNFALGNLLVSNIVLILHKSPFPPRYAANWQPTYSILQENLIYQVSHLDLDLPPDLSSGSGSAS